MGCVDTIRFGAHGLCFPAQSDWVGQRVRVSFHYQSALFVWGTVVRDDKDLPHETLISLDDGPIVRAVECQHTHPEADDKSLVRAGSAGPRTPEGKPND